MYITSLTTHCHHKSSCLNTTTSTMAGIIAPIAVCLALISVAAAVPPQRRSPDCSNVTVEGSHLDSRNCSDSEFYPYFADWKFTFHHNLHCPGLPCVNVQYDIDIGCGFDYLTLGSNTDRPVWLCGAWYHQLSASNISEAYEVRFHASGNTDNRGFRLNVTFTCSPEFGLI